MKFLRMRSRYLLLQRDSIIGVSYEPPIRHAMSHSVYLHLITGERLSLTSGIMQDVILSILDEKEMLKIILAVSKHCDWAEFCEEDFSPEELEIFLSHRDFDKAVSYAQSFLASMELKEEKTDRNKYKSICI